VPLGQSPGIRFAFGAAGTGVSGFRRTHQQALAAHAENGSYKATAERLILHKNSVQYRIRKAEEALGHPVAENRLSVELALLASQSLGATVLRHLRQPRP
jgi:DNA-binding PucR family transcriptional regulator